MTVRVGIDLGTTYSLISWFDGAILRTFSLEAADNKPTLPSVVYYDKDEKPTVGCVAERMGPVQPDRVVRLMKRYMGVAGYIHEGTNKNPVEVSSEIIKCLIAEAEKEIGEKISEAVITIPAYFGDAERADTYSAGIQAGLTYVELLTEPYAAALAYSIENAYKLDNSNLMVYDLGGGTLDVTLVRTRSKKTGGLVELKPDTLEKDGTVRLGGADWDKVLFELVCGEVQRVHKTKAYTTPQGENDLIMKVEQAKRHLSNIGECQVFGENASLAVTIKRKDFEEACHAQMLRAEMTLTAVFNKVEKKQGIIRQDIAVLLCGGSTKMPMVRNMIERVSGKPPLSYKNPDLLVSMGAGYHAHISAGGKIPTKGGLVSIDPTSVRDRLTHGIGIYCLKDEGKSEFILNVIKAGTELDGVRYKSKPVFTIRDNSTEVEIDVYEGNSEVVSECKLLGSGIIEGLPPNRPKGKEISVELACSSDGIVFGEAWDVESNKRVTIRIDRSKRNSAIAI